MQRTRTWRRKCRADKTVEHLLAFSFNFRLAVDGEVSKQIKNFKTHRRKPFLILAFSDWYGWQNFFWGIIRLFHPHHLRRFSEFKCNSWLILKCSLLRSLINDCDLLFTYYRNFFISIQNRKKIFNKADSFIKFQTVENCRGPRRRMIIGQW